MRDIKSGRLQKDIAINGLKSLGAVVADYDHCIYADGECSHCGSTFTYGNIDVDVETQTVSSAVFAELCEEIRRKRGVLN